MISSIANNIKKKQNPRKLVLTSERLKQNRLPGLKNCIGLLLTAWRLRNKGFMAWPNISAGRMIVPEKIGKIYPQQIAQEAAEWLSSPKRLYGQQEDLRSLRGQPGAVEKMTQEIMRN